MLSVGEISWAGAGKCLCVTVSSFSTFSSIWEHRLSLAVGFQTSHLAMNIQDTTTRRLSSSLPQITHSHTTIPI